MDKQIQERNRKLFQGQNLDAILIAKHESFGNDRNFHHVTGVGGDFAYSFAVVYPDGSATLLVSEMEADEAETLHMDYVQYQKLSDALKDVTKGAKNIGLNYSGVTAEFLMFLQKRIGQMRFPNIAPQILESRLEKTKDEMRMIREACNISSKLAKRIPGMIKTGMTELQLAAAIEHEMKSLGSTQPSFRTIVAFGGNSAIPHYNTSTQKLKDGDLILCDYGATVGYMTSDTTVTLVKGKPQTWQKELYKLISQIQSDSIKKLKIGGEVKPIQDNAQHKIKDFFNSRKWQGGMTHGLGHSFGLYVHDGYRLGQENFKVPEGFLTTVEPGGYIPRRGGVRIEDCIFVGRKVENLTDVNPGELVSV